jgi:flagellar biosynthesis chaperone FliJ
MPKQKNPNRPPATHMVRLSDKGFEVLERLRKKKAQPYPRILESILTELDATQKKVQALKDENLELAQSCEEYRIVNTALLRIQKKQAADISRLEDIIGPPIQIHNE